MRPLLLSLVLLVTGCATAPRAKTASERLAELKRERQGALAPASPEATASEVPPEQPAPPTPPEAPAPPVPEAPQPPAPPEHPPMEPAAPAAPEAPPAPTAPVSPSAPVQGNGPHKGALGLHGSLVGSVTGTGTGSLSTVGVRYFVSDWVGLNLEAGFSIGAAEQATVSGLGLGVGVNLYGDSPDAALRPYFTTGLGFTSVTAGSTGLISVAVSAGGGLEYWVLPRLSVNASLLLNLAAVPEADTFALATVRPGLGVTLYTP
ncbi:outer membrane beta-barrel protein [Cystobacter fuscus]|uniref:outer membrane beta-barrel protein n=1 Tax=Cystobacter fuscus TaxID=43 RepID=UPI0012DF4947|nr:outer membrane beta-barrel protein [Cystobacter fuscus]